MNIHPIFGDRYMMILVSYDIAQNENGIKRLSKVAKICQNYGQRVQNSVFECLVDPREWEELRNKLENIFNPQYDSLRYYFLGKNWKNKVEHKGAKKGFDPEGTLIL